MSTSLLLSGRGRHCRCSGGSGLRKRGAGMRSERAQFGFDSRHPNLNALKYLRHSGLRAGTRLGGSPPAPLLTFEPLRVSSSYFDALGVVPVVRKPSTSATRLIIAHMCVSLTKATPEAVHWAQSPGIRRSRNILCLLLLSFIAMPAAHTAIHKSLHSLLRCGMLKIS